MDKIDKERLEQEFTRIVSEHKSTIYKVCYMFSTNNTQVQDLSQEVLINLWRSLPGFEGKSSMKTWVWRISLYTCIAQEKKRSRRSNAE